MSLTHFIYVIRGNQKDAHHETKKQCQCQAYDEAIKALQGTIESG
jgi:hypothetical protein